jgi:uncharacterized protein YuzE
MELSYSPRHGVAYIRFQDRLVDAPVETVQVSEDVNIDLAPDGSVYGVELLNANEQLGRTNGRAVVVTNEETGEVQRLALDLPD